MAKKTGDDELINAATIATELGIHKTTVNRIASEYGIGKKLNEGMTSSQRIFVRSDIPKIKKHCYFSKGNPQLRKKSRKPA